MKKIIILVTLGIVCIFTPSLNAQNFEEFFTDSTLRLDYTFQGTAQQQSISLAQLNQIPHWWGKRTRLAELPVQGNGEIIVRDEATRKEIYRNSFSTLFQEWLSFPEAQTTARTFENVFLVPFPKKTIEVTVTLRNKHHKQLTSFTHKVDPTDILIRKIGAKPLHPIEPIIKAKNHKKAIDIAFIAEGYTRNEMKNFIADCKKATNAIFKHEPFHSERDNFNVVAVCSASVENGTSTPRTSDWRNTLLRTNFDTFYSDRYLTTLNLFNLHDQLAGIPYEHIIILVNTDTYGGGGILNSYNLASTKHPQFEPVVVHEFGHSFAGLADEYAYESGEVDPQYPSNIEPWEKNITTLVNFSSKWKRLINKETPIPTPVTETNGQTIGVYEGAGYCSKGVYRPMQNCRMRTNECPVFCVVCQHAIKELIDFYCK